MTSTACPAQRSAAAAASALKKDLQRLRRLAWRCTLCTRMVDCPARESVGEWIDQAAQRVLDELERYDG